ncbi:hypothetical protein LP52_07525 [Streptomonospora alba]|uniref:Uncharacterized protein n=1 Tax=Streptomonospora alba TaxID=183763 RepID=A0A0C2FJD9_9ACTN|nr:hypothetical protein [Streptomonospora alba]KIH99469.1 hypothetical protein LP52_07525 [Streptomonospora alba]
MTPPYRYKGGGHGEVHPPGTVAEDYGQDWTIRCYRWSGQEYWTAERHEKAPDDAPDGVRNEVAHWSSEAAMRTWLEAQSRAWRRWRSTRVTG